MFIKKTSAVLAACALSVSLSLVPASQAEAGDALKGAVIGAGVGGLVGGKDGAKKGLVAGGIAGAIIGN